MGDGLLAEFGSVVDAVCCGTEIQKSLTARDASIPEDKRIKLRIGINMGDVVIDGDDIHGDGVNVAARLESLADPGSVLISAVVCDQVEGRLDLAFDDLGEQNLKNIDEPVRLWRWSSDSGERVNPMSAKAQAPMKRDKPSIAVLPFDNMSGDPEQDYFADGIAEDIITALSRFHWFFVISRNTSFTYRGKSIDAKRVAKELGVRYVLEGSVRKSANRVRVTAQLIDAETPKRMPREVS